MHKQLYRLLYLILKLVLNRHPINCKIRCESKSIIYRPVDITAARSENFTRNFEELLLGYDIKIHYLGSISIRSGHLSMSVPRFLSKPQGTMGKQQGNVAPLPYFITSFLAQSRFSRVRFSVELWPLMSPVLIPRMDMVHRWNDNN
jgi:hypothetical protein